ncbi:MAG: 3'(2'),5'-bisphosphate nucleotidase CysQ [Nanobdellota archaeon]
MIEDIKDIARKAGEKTLEIYNKDFETEYKDDKSPLTEADLASNEVIVDGLKKISDHPILSEETKEVDHEERKGWDKFWLIDPLDGTKEFIKRNGEFTVNIALIEDGEPTFGVVYVPVKDQMYYSYNGKSYLDGEELPFGKERDNFVVVASRSHFNDETKEYIEKITSDYELISRGSSLKLCAVAEGSADIYPRLGPTMEWDTAAAHAVVRGAGREVYDVSTNKPLKYNKESLKNPFFVVK